MEEDKVKELLAVVRKWAVRRGCDEGRVVTAQSLAWFLATRCPTPYPPSHWARLAVFNVLHGRDLTGCGTSHADALTRSWQGAGLAGLADRSPRPDQNAADAEHWQRLLAVLTDAEREVLLARLGGERPGAIARRRGCTGTHVSRLLRCVKNRAAELRRGR